MERFFFFFLSQVTKNRFDGVLGRVPLEFVRESLSMSGFGKVLQPNKSLNFDRSRPAKFKPTRLTSDVEVVKFSAPKMIGSNKIISRNTATTQPSVEKENVESIANNCATNSTSHRQREKGSQMDSEGKMADHDIDAGISEEKKQSVQRTVKRILSGTRLITKAVNGPRNNYFRANIVTDRNKT